MNTVDQKLKGIIMKNMRIGIEVEDIEEDSDIINDFMFDSIQILRLITHIENEFDIVIENEDNLVDMLQCYGSLRAYIEERIAMEA